MRANRYAQAVLVLMLVMASNTDCAMYRMRDVDHKRLGSAQYEGGVKWSFFWGIINGKIDADCNKQPVSEVVVRSNLGFQLISIVTLGMASPVSIQWKCASPTPAGGELELPDSTEGNGANR